MPTVLDYVGYRGKFMAFGNSIFDTTAERYAYNFHTPDYMILDNNYFLQFNGGHAIGLYEYKKDSTMGKNLLFEYPDVTASMEQKLKAIIQTHHHVMINNKLVAE